MFCGKCGKEIPEGVTQCPCSVSDDVNTIPENNAPLTEETPVIENVEEKVKKPFNKKLFIIIASVILGIAILGVAGLIVYNIFFNKLDIMQFVKFDEAKGLNNYASITYTVDFTSIAQELEFEELRDIKKLDKLIKSGDVATPVTSKDAKLIGKNHKLDLEEIEDLLDAVTFTLDKKENLKNDDTVTLTIEVDEDVADFKKNLTGGSLAYKVSGLNEAEIIDLFNNVNVVFEGKSGKANAYVNTNNYDYAIKFVLDKETDISNGDTVTVTATVDEELYEDYLKQALEDNKYLPKTSTKTFTAEGLNSYISDKAQFTDDAVNDLITLTRTIKKDVEEYNELKYDSAYVYYLKMEEDSYYRDVVVITLKYKDKFSITVCHENCIITPEGKIISETTKYRTLRQGKDYTREDIETAATNYYYDDVELIKIK